MNSSVIGRVEHDYITHEPVFATTPGTQVQYPSIALVQVFSVVNALHYAGVVIQPVAELRALAVQVDR